MEACAVICRKTTFTISVSAVMVPMPISSLPGANPCLPEHKIEVFVRFWGLEPSFSGISSTKSGFLCAFAVLNPCFLAFRAQNRHFCALFAFGTLIFGHFEHKIGVFVLFGPLEPPFSGFPSTKLGFLCAVLRGVKVVV